MPVKPKPKQATTADRFGAATTFLTLPVPGPGGVELVVEIEAATIEELIPLMKGIAGLEKESAEGAGRDPLEVTLEFVRLQGERARPLVDRFVRTPRISFDGSQPGMVDWSGLHLINRLAIVNAISEFSQNGSVRRAERLVTFLAENEGGRGDGGDAGVALQNGHAATPEAAIAE